MPQIVTGHTKLYAILGDPIAQVGSPVQFNRLFTEAEHDGIMVPMRVAAEDLREAFVGLRKIETIGGLVFTIPHKIAMCDLVDELAPNGARVGAINAARRLPDGSWQGDMFDGRGCVAALANDGRDLGGRRVLQIGAGGVGRAIAFAFAEAGVAGLTIFDIEADRAEGLATDVGAAFSTIKAVPGAARVDGHDTVVNCTPLGMKADDPLPVPVDAMAGVELAIDVILSDEPTPFLAAAKRQGCGVQNGHQMLGGQVGAIAAFFGVT